MSTRAPHAKRSRSYGATQKKPARERVAPHPLRFGPNLYIAHTQPGFEAIAADEIAARVAGAREITRRGVPDRAGMTIFFAPNAQKLTALRTVEDLFGLAGYRAGLPPEIQSLEKIRASAREAPLVDAALQARVKVSLGARAGRRLKFRVIARMAGEHEFRRVDFQRAVERGIVERTDHTWRLEEGEEAEVEFWATMIDSEFFLTVRLSDDRMRHREYKAAHRPASLRASSAAALAWLSEPHDDDVVLDPFCGAGTILIERAHLGKYAMLLGSDRDQAALAAARTNVGARYKPIQLENWDAAAIPLGDASVGKIVTNLPWGIRYGSHGENRKLYPEWFREFARVLKSGGTMVLLTAEWRLMRDLERSRKLSPPSKVIRVSLLGTPASVYVIKMR
ncbi:MAG TPA: methyltransferase domain-containing protein [Sporolactobacillaceae bacterium]|nr:methyltransferase domain-containing protein [Sporolactobacillaceae bacterium]